MATTDNPNLLIYGAYGYTGDLIARRAVAAGLKPVLAGRDEARLARLADELKLPHRAFALSDPAKIDAALADVTVVIHAAGPFAHTARAMAEACIRTKTHYLDITGEIEVFETMAALGKKAAAAGVMLLPGSGFDVVPSDCLAAHLKRRLPSATDLKLAFRPLGGAVSHGTAMTAVENIHRGGLIRRDGKLTPVPAGRETRSIDFSGDGRLTATMTIPWGDVSTAYYSTGIPNIEVYFPSPALFSKAMRYARPLLPLLGTSLGQTILKKWVDARPAGPTAQQRESGASLLWGEAHDHRTGATVTSRIKTLEGYKLTAVAAVMLAQKALAGKAPAGFQTPSLAYGADLVMEIDGTVRFDA